MKTDRELLELAAKAAGMGELIYMTETERYAVVWLPAGGDCNEWMFWNPLTDDGDALRLAATLGISIAWSISGRVYAYAKDGMCIESSREDRQPNVRRAIVRAAAAIGEAME